MFYAYFFVWETKGLTLEQVDRMMEETGSPRNSPGWTAHGSYAAEMGEGEGEGGKMAMQGHHGEVGEKARFEDGSGTAHLNNNTDTGVNQNRSVV